MKKVLIIWAVVIILLYAVVSGVGYPNAFDNVLGVAIISFFVIFVKAFKTWKGEVVEVKTEEKHIANDDGPSETVNVNYAYIKLTNGKTKKIRNMAWKVGDKLEKKRWQFGPQSTS